MLSRISLVALLVAVLISGRVGPRAQSAVPHALPFPGAAPTTASSDALRWCWQAPRAVTPPDVSDPRFQREAIDRFVFARLRSTGLAPAAAAEPAAWLRRVRFDLTGLPPSIEETQAFLADPSAAAREAIVDRLLASPDFGERWARHWMDLVRYAETMGHEFDYPILGAWRYRDWLIQAFNSDLRYDRFVVEHLAGDLLPDPRRDPDTGLPLSPLATTGLVLGEQSHAPIDTKQSESDRVDNLIDVVSKSFLGVTLACARCHDHKFDPIPTTDYYAAYSILASAQPMTRVLLSEAGLSRHRELAQRADDAKRLALEAAAAQLPARLASLLLASRDFPSTASAEPAAAAAESASIVAVAARHAIDAASLKAIVDLLRRPELANDPRHPLHVWAALRDATPEQASARWKDVSGSAAPVPVDRPRDLVVADASDPGAATWVKDGPAFDDALVRDACFVEPRDDGAAILRVMPGTWFHSGLRSKRETGTLRTPDFRLDRRYLFVRVAGRHARMNVTLDGFTLVRGPIYDAMKQELGSDTPRWLRIDLDIVQGRRASLEFVDLPAPDPADPMHPGGWDARGWLAFGKAILSDHPDAPADDTSAAREWLGREAPANVEALAARYADALHRGVLHLLGQQDGDPRTLPLIASLADAGLLLAQGDALGTAVTALREADTALPEPVFATTLGRGNDVIEPVHIRGGHRSPGELVPPRFFRALGAEPLRGDGNGRLAWAMRIASPDNPLTARVAVNRVWHHLLGRGLVPTVDNFGKLGEDPTHPELLDWLTLRFLADGWSMKTLIRRIVLSETYGLSSRHDDTELAAKSELVDPDVKLFHRTRVRRLEGEAIRDAMLALSGRLDPKRYGPSVPVHLTPFMDGRGRPGQSGPADGDGRRSVYLEVRRNFLSPFFLAFDVPLPFSTVGVRGNSNVPGQALALLNDPFTMDQARLWSLRMLARTTDGDASDELRSRVASFYLAAFVRAPSAQELATALAFLGEAPDPDAWAEFAHVLWNVKDFIYLH